MRREDHVPAWIEVRERDTDVPPAPRLGWIGKVDGTLPAVWGFLRGCWMARDAFGAVLGDPPGSFIARLFATRDDAAAAVRIRAHDAARARRAARRAADAERLQ